MINKPVKTIGIKKPEIKSKKTEEVGVKHTSKLNAIIVGAIIAFIFGYIIFDFFVVKERIENKIQVVNQKFDSLQLYLNNKLPEIDNAIKIQSQQVEDLRNMKDEYTE